uniref:Pre-mRNA-processing factor 39 n=1 Tax=Timema genevievae TaxID=629358 RepID=A0A7R9JY95_TIMGE|nr:unnamed protein product [Timema genevievae]
MALADQWGSRPRSLGGPGIAVPGPHWSCSLVWLVRRSGLSGEQSWCVGLVWLVCRPGLAGERSWCVGLVWLVRRSGLFETTARRTRTTRNVARRGRGRKKTVVNPPRSTRSKRSKKEDSDDDDDDVQEIETQAASDVENSDTVEQEVSNTDGEDLLASPEEELNEAPKLSVNSPVKNGLQEVEFVENVLVSKETHSTKKDAEEEGLEDSNEEDVDKVIVEILNPDPDVKPTDSDKDRSPIQTGSANRESVESCSEEEEETEAVVITQVPELEEAPPPSVNKLLPSPSIISNLRQKSVEADANQTKSSHDSGEEGQSDDPEEQCENKQEEEEEVGNANMDEMTVIDEVMEEGDEKDDSGAAAKSELKKEGEVEEDFPTEPDTEMVSEDELPTETAKEQLDTELVSDEELPDPATAADLPETEAVSEDELPPEKTDKKKKTASKSSDNKEGVADSTTKSKKKSEAQKRKLAEGDTYDPSSPTSENSCDESPAAKRAAVSSGGSDVKSKPVKARKALPELDKYWKAVKEDSSDFTGWTYLLQYVDQENDLEAAREAYDAFLSHYPYCYGYWRKYADYEKRKGNKEKCEEVFERGLKAIPLSVDLWIHYLNYCKAAYADNEDHLRTQFEKAISACGMEFRHVIWI